MYSKTTQNKQLKKIALGNLNSLKDCKVSKASTEIMLDRFCNGNKVEFPFLNY